MMTVQLTDTVDGEIVLLYFPIEIGECLYGTEAGINDYSRIDVDGFGGITIIQRKYTNTVSYRVKIPSANVDAVYTLLTMIRAKKCVFIGVSTKLITKVTGYMMECEITQSHCESAILRLDVES